MAQAHAPLNEFERAVYTGEPALPLLLQCLKALREGGGFGPNHEMGPTPVTRMVSAVVAFFMRPTFVPTQEEFHQICNERNALDTLFQASVHGNSDFVTGLITETTENLNKFLLLHSINSRLPLDLDLIFKAHPQEMIGLWLSLVGHGQVFNEVGDTRREKLIAMAPYFEGVTVPPALLNTLTSAYMHCSYGHGKDKHAIKRVLHKIIRNTVPVEECSAEKRPRKDKPTMLVCHEWWHRRHAMYRSYARSIEQLRKKFHLIGMAIGGLADDESRLLFDQWVEIQGDAIVLSEIAKKIREINPDVIYYPSIGMSVWVIAMASFRLAPIQVISYGHPATTHSPVIDYGIIEADTFVADRFSEKVLTLPPNVVRPTEFQRIDTRHVPRKSDTLKIAVTAMQVKVSWPFVKAMQEVCRRATKKIEFHFCSAVHGIGLYSFCNEMTRLLPNVTVQEVQQYPDYMATLAGCDLALFSFPFGGTNSMIDAMTVGVPMVTMLGQEPHSQSDTALVRRAGLPESLVAKTEAEYVDAVLKMQGDDYRALVSELVKGVNVEQKFFRPDDSEAFLQTFTKIYEENSQGE